MSFHIDEVDTKNKNCQKELIDYLAKNEARALFLIGNLTQNFQSSFIYVAKQNKQIIGVCCYYYIFKSCSIYAETDVASKELAKKVIAVHSISSLLGMKHMIKPAYEEFLKYKKKAINNPEKLFFELDMNNFKPYFTEDGEIGPIEKNDIDEAVLLQRQIHNIPKENPITEEDRLKVIKSSVKFGVKINGKLISIATSNGLAIKAFQILGVATKSNYKKKGYAKAVCSHLISYMKKKGANKAVIFTGENNTAAKKCYLDLGFQIVDKYYFALFES